MRRTDVWIVAGVLVLALAAFLVMTLTRAGQQISGDVAVYVDGELYETARLDTPGEILVTQPGGEENLIRIENGSFFMAHSSCNNQLCVQQGAVTAENWVRRSMGRSIICLPNRVLVELSLDENHPSLEEDAPDI